MTMNLAICDDEAIFCEMLIEAIEANAPTEVDITVYNSGEALTEDYLEAGKRFDAVFLDLEMGEGRKSGIITADEIRALDERVDIIFVTSHTSYAKDCFYCNLLRFLTKPVEGKFVREALNAIDARLKRVRVPFVIDNKKCHARLYCDEILYFESARNWIKVHTKDEVYLARMCMNALEKTLPEAEFCRVHRGFIVRLDAVRSFDKDSIKLTHDDITIPLGRNYKNTFHEVFLNHTYNSLRRHF